MANDPVTVAVGVIRQNGLLLVGQRVPEREFPLTWEFPGGKVEASDISIEHALAREMQEELGIGILDATEFYRCQSVTQEHVTLVFHLITDFIGVPSMRDHAGLRWMTPSRIKDEMVSLPMINSNAFYCLEQLDAYYAEHCKCGREACVCRHENGHMENCKFKLAACGSLALTCDHGNNVCVLCDKCTCP